jgi:hypothetical protein
MTTGASGSKLPKQLLAVMSDDRRFKNSATDIIFEATEKGEQSATKVVTRDNRSLSRLLRARVLQRGQSC